MQKCLILVGYKEGEDGLTEKIPENEIWEEGYYLGLGQAFRFYDNSALPYSVIIVAHKETGEVRPVPLDCAKLIFNE